MPIPSIDEVREYIQDYPVKNIKYDDFVFSDADLEVALKWTKKHLSSIPPLFDIPLEQYPDFIWLKGILTHLFYMKYINASLNMAPAVQENGIALPEGELAPIYEKLYKESYAEFTNIVSTWKQATAIRNSFTSIRSPYNRITRRNVNDIKNML